MRITRIQKHLLLILLAIGTTLSTGVLHASENILQTEFVFNYDFNTDAWVIDAFDDGAGDVALQFGNSINETIQFDTVNDWFEFSNDVNLNQNEIKNFAVDNLALAPLSPVEGQMYYDTSDNNTYVWNGTMWEDITASASSSHTQNTDIGTNQETFTLDLDDVSVTDITLEFGALLGETLTYNKLTSQFELSDNIVIDGDAAVVGDAFIADDHSAANSDGTLNLGRYSGTWQQISFDQANGEFVLSNNTSIGGQLGIDGTTMTLDENNTGTGVNVNIVANQGTDPDGILRYNATTNKWEIANDGVNYYEVASSAMQFEDLYTWDTDNALITSNGNFTVNTGTADLIVDSNDWQVDATGNLTLAGDANVSGNADVTGTLDVTGTGTFNNDLVVGTDDTDSVTFNSDVNSDFIPNADLTYDLGSATKRWNTIYVDNIETGSTGGNINFGETGLSFTFTNAQTTTVGGRSFTIETGDLVKINNTGGEEVLLTTSKNNSPIGIAANDSNFGQDVEVIVIGKGYANCTGSILAGELVQSSNTTGLVQEGNNSTKIVGTALSTCSGGQVYIVVHLN